MDIPHYWLVLNGEYDYTKDTIINGAYVSLHENTLVQRPGPVNQWKLKIKKSDWLLDFTNWTYKFRIDCQIYALNFILHNRQFQMIQYLRGPVYINVSH
jgi:hypothetical protein